ncbi:hypothetical protein [Actinomyces bowdenii]|uniref:Uncharacterized protein n=1 Tax=Actinomyces bowdenii TaxID=131109 RepID=A0A853EM64_9ACTO|nr:hypothetical protein [Actinomyces bowdenii]MBF0696723.1 hypothetical protein [Actinomyces bowdenii]NYS68896.1 hypothetical protein [Actinomyces bowdenii]
MTTTVAERAAQAQTPTTAQQTAAQQTTDAQAEARRLTFMATIVAMMITVATMAAVGVVTSIPALLLASAALTITTVGVGLYTGLTMLPLR